MKKLLLTATLAASVFGLSACSTEADRVSENLAKSADSFKVERRIIFVNTMTDKYLLSAEGRCSLDAKSSKKVAVVCKIGKDKYLRHTMGLSSNVTYVVEQLEAKHEDPFHYKIIYRPEEIIPDIDLQTSKD